MEPYRQFSVRVRNPYPWDLRSEEFRLAALLPGNWNDRIQCELFCVSRLKKPRCPGYQALSYAWGMPSRQSPRIIVNGCEFEVTVNLETALRLLRDTEKPIYLWIDALCINQRNNEERSLQVSKMRAIYSEAEQVIVFLGGDPHPPKQSHVSPNSETCFTFKGNDSDKDLISQCLFRWKRTPSAKHASAVDIFCLISILSQPVYQGNAFKCLEMISEHRLTTVFEALRRMLIVRWWDRIWVVQEAVVAEAMVVRYGNASMPWKTLASVAQLYQQGSISNYPSSVSPNDAKVLRLLSRVTDLDHFRDTWRERKKDLDLLELLRRFRNRKSSDSRDKVFALVGLCGPWQTIPPDYSWDEITVYQNYVVEMVQRKRSLSPLSGDIGRKNRQDIPSWLPDWSATFEEYDRGREALFDLYDACGGVGSNIWTYRETIKSNSMLNPRNLDNARRGDRQLGGAMKERYESNNYQAPELTEDAYYGSKYIPCCDPVMEILNQMKLLAKTLELDNGIQGYLPDYVGILMEKYKTSLTEKLETRHSAARFSNESRTIDYLISLCNKLQARCVPKGTQGGSVRYLNYNFLSLENSPSASNPGGELKMRGQRIGKIARTFEPFYSCSNMDVVSEETHNWAIGIFEHADNVDHVAFGKTLLSDLKLTKNGPQRLEKEDERHLEFWLRCVLWKEKCQTCRTAQPNDQVIESFTAALQLSVTKRSFFITEDGVMGLGPGSIQSKDEIYILPGGKMPFVLRQVSRDHPRARFSNQSVFNLVGECYVDKHMDGQKSLPNEGSIPDYCFEVARLWLSDKERYYWKRLQDDLNINQLYLV